MLASTTDGDEDDNNKEGAFSFLWGSERRNGFMHLELYTFLPFSGRVGSIHERYGRRGHKRF